MVDGGDEPMAESCGEGYNMLWYALSSSETDLTLGTDFFGGTTPFSQKSSVSITRSPLSMCIESKLRRVLIESKLLMTLSELFDEEAPFLLNAMARSGGEQMTEGGGEPTEGGGEPMTEGGGEPMAEGGGEPMTEGGGEPMAEGGGEPMAAEGGGEPMTEGGGEPMTEGGGEPMTEGGGEPMVEGSGEPMTED